VENTNKFILYEKCTVTDMKSFNYNGRNPLIVNIPIPDVYKNILKFSDYEIPCFEGEFLKVHFIG
jgi:hypothetical protein